MLKDLDRDDRHDRGYAAVDLETVTTFAAAKYDGGERVSILSMFDNPRHDADLGMDELAKSVDRARGLAAVLELGSGLVDSRD